MSNKEKQEEGVGSFVDPKDLEKKKNEEEAKKILQESTSPEAPLFKKMDSIVEALQGIDEKLCRIADHLAGVETKEESEKTITEARQAVAPKGPEPPTPQPEDDNISSVKILFPQDLEEKLNFSLENDKVKVAPKQYLGSDNFAKIASIIREAGGEYVSAGRESHFLVPPLTTQESQSASGPSLSKADEIRSKFPPVIAELLNFTESDGKIIVKAKQYLGSDNFANIASIVREAGGEYVSEGKNSRFEVPIK